MDVVKLDLTVGKLHKGEVAFPRCLSAMLKPRESVVFSTHESGIILVS